MVRQSSNENICFRGTYLERFSGILVQSAVVVQYIYKLKLMPHAHFVIVRIMSGSDLHGACSEFHIDGFGVGYDRYKAIYEWMSGKSTVEVLKVKLDNGQ